MQKILKSMVQSIARISNGSKISGCLTLQLIHTRNMMFPKITRVLFVGCLPVWPITTLAQFHQSIQMPTQIKILNSMAVTGRRGCKRNQHTLINKVLIKLMYLFKDFNLFISLTRENCNINLISVLTDILFYHFLNICLRVILFYQ